MQDRTVKQDGYSPKTVFDAASVKPNPVPLGHTIFTQYPSQPLPQFIGNRYLQPFATAQDLIMQAYAVNGFQILNLPSWARAPEGEHYYIEARAPGFERPSVAEGQQMLRALLEDRFQLKLHKITEPVLVYSLRVVDGGPKWRLLDAESQLPTSAVHPQLKPTLSGTFMELVQYLRLLVNDRPVLDDTDVPPDLKIEFVNPRWIAEGDQQSQDRATPQDKAYSWLKALGLRLESRKKPIEVLVVDNVARPSPN